MITKLDQLEIQLTATELPRTSPQLAQLHAQCSRAIEEATSVPIAEGYAILDLIGRGSSGSEGVKQMVIFSNFPMNLYQIPSHYSSFE